MLHLIERPGTHALVRVAPSTRAVVSWNAAAPSGRLALIAHRADGTVSNALPYVHWAPSMRRSLDGADAVTRIAIDIVRSDVPLTAIEIESSVALDAVAVTVPPAAGTRAPRVERVAPLEVPEASQYLAAFPRERGWCSAASLAMLMRAHGIDASVNDVADGVFDSSYRGHGNWAFNAAYAGAHGLRAVVAYLSGLDHVAAFLAAGLPVAISISWHGDQLPGAPLEHSDGHLLVVRGMGRAWVDVNDPAAPAIATRYPRAALDRVFREHGGVAYLVAPPARSAELAALANAGGSAAQRT